MKNQDHISLNDLSRMGTTLQWVYNLQLELQVQSLGDVSLLEEPHNCIPLVCKVEDLKVIVFKRSICIPHQKNRQVSMVTVFHTILYNCTYYNLVTWESCTLQSKIHMQPSNTHASCAYSYYAFMSGKNRDRHRAISPH